MRFRNLMVLMFTVLVATALLTPSLLAQSIVTGGITGTVSDPSGAIVPNATVTLKSAETATTRTTTTNASGLYNFPLLKPGDYTVSITHSGFRTVNQEVVVPIGVNVTTNIKLAVGNTSETVEVTSQAPLLQTEDANIATSVTQKQIDQLPNPGNDITYIAQISPGIAINTGGGYGNFSAFGLPATSNLFTINGNDEMDPYLNLNNSGATNLLLGKNELQEASVVSNGYTGQYGRQAGAQIDVATKSGSNAFHGNAQYWWNGSSVNANDWFANHTVPATPHPFQNNNQWAASVGGPIMKDKLFFFVNTEGLRYILSTSNQIFLPNALFQSVTLGNLTAGGLTASIPFYNSMFNLFNTAPGASRATAVTAADDPGLGCGDFADPVSGLGLAANGGADIPCATTFRSTAGQLSTEWILSGRVDYNYDQNNKFFIRFKTDHGRQPTYTDAINPAFDAISIQPQYEGQINYTHIFNPNMVNNFIASVSWYSAIFKSVDAAKATALFPYALYSFDAPFGNPSTAIVLGGENNVFPQGRNVTQYQFVDDLSITKGNHNLKVGGNFRRNDVSDYIFGVRTIPRARIFSTTDFANGIIDQFSQRFPERFGQPIALWSLGAYFQDEYRVNSKLKLTMAIRVDRNSNAVCQTDCFNRLVGDFNTIGHDVSTPYNQSIQTGLHSAFPNLEKVVFQPRFGFAYSPWGDKTVIRGGIGLFSDLYPATLVDNYAGNAPGRTTFTLAGLPFAPAEAGSAGTTVPLCNTAFQTTFAGGGTVGDFFAAAPGGCARPDINSVANSVRNPKYLEWNLEVQHQIDDKTSFSVNYVGNHGYDLFTNNFLTNSWCRVALGCPTPFEGLSTSRPDGRFQNVTNLANTSRSNYDGLSVSLKRRLTYGFQGQFNYTWSHTLDSTSNGGVLPFGGDSQLGQFNPFNLDKLNYSNSDYDFRHNITASYVWDLPFKSSSKGLNMVIGGWALSGDFFYRTGIPFTVSDSGVGYVGNIANQIYFIADAVTAVPHSCGGPTAVGYTGCFAVDAGGVPTQFIGSGTETSFGNTKRNSFRGPAYFNSNFTVNKNFKLTERVNFMFGVNFFNVFNHPNFANPLWDIGSGQFGQVVSTVAPPTSPYGAFVGASASGRITQFTGKITF